MHKVIRIISETFLGQNNTQISVQTVIGTLIVCMLCSLYAELDTWYFLLNCCYFSYSHTHHPSPFLNEANFTVLIKQKILCLKTYKGAGNYLRLHHNLIRLAVVLPTFLLQRLCCILCPCHNKFLLFFGISFSEDNGSSKAIDYNCEQIGSKNRNEKVLKKEIK